MYILTYSTRCRLLNGYVDCAWSAILHVTYGGHAIMLTMNGGIVSFLSTRQRFCLIETMLVLTSDSRMLLTGSDDMHIHMYDANNASLIEAMSGGRGAYHYCCMFHLSNVHED